MIKVTSKMVADIVGHLPKGDIDYIANNAPEQETLEDVYEHVCHVMSEFHYCDVCASHSAYDEPCEFH